MSKIKLQPVEVQKYDTCVSYCLKRLGIYNDVQIFQSYDLVYSPHFEHIAAGKRKIGDLLVWCDVDSRIGVPREIDKKGRIITHRAIDNGHTEIYEGGEFVTGLYSITNSNGWFGIQRRRLDNMGEPDYIVRYKG